MLDKSNKKVIMGIVGAAVAVFIIVLVALSLIDDECKKGTPDAQLTCMIKGINVNTPTHDVGQVPPTTSDLPDISEYPPQVNSSTSSYIEIFSSTEKAGSGTDGWLTEVARDFNNAKMMIDGKQVSVRLRGIASGEGYDYITSGTYLPDAYTPSNELWGEMIISKGVKAQLVQKRLSGNVAGILLTKAKKDELVAKYGVINIKTIVDAVANNELQMGYTNPLASSTGLNFLISTLQTFDRSNLLSDKAINGFKGFQNNVRLVAYTTLQLRNAAKSGHLDGLILEYQTYVNTPDLRSYEFIPFGDRHDSPIYAIGELSAEKMNILNKFVEFSQQEKYQTLATKYGFNGLNEHKSNAGEVSGDMIIQAQKLWKDTKDRGKNICAVFVADVSGSMEGEPLNELKRSLLQGQHYINESNQVGLISYSNDVDIDLPIAKFDQNQRSKFAGAVRELQAGGNTATYDGIIVAMQMLIEQRAAGPNKDPNLKPKIFVLSDGFSNRGYSLEDIRGIVEYFGVPVYTIGYNNADMQTLQAISDINEAACINADTQNVVDKLKKLFAAEM